MAGEEPIVQDDFEEPKDGDYNLEKLLSLVVKRRKTFPAACMELNKQAAHFELLRMENAKIITEGNNTTEEFKKISQEVANKKPFDFTLDDLNEVKQKLDKYRTRNEEVNKYLEKRQMSKFNHIN